MSNIVSLRDHVRNYISDKIKSGELKPHEKLNEVQICDDLDISRTPAREALIILASENLIDYSPRKGFFVKEVTLEDKLQNYALIGNLDAFAAVLSVDRLTDNNIMKMHEIIANMDVAIRFHNYDSYTSLQYDFHNIYIENCGNKPLIRILTMLENSFIPITYVDSQPDMSEDDFFSILQGLNEEHKKILELIESKDKVALEQFIKEVHWQTKYEDMV